MGGRYRGKLLEFGESVLVHLPDVGKGSWNPAPKLADRWRSAVWLGKSDLTDEHLVRTDEGVVYARSVRRLVEKVGQEKNFEQVSKHQRSRSRRQRTSFLQPNFSLFLLKLQKYLKMRRRDPKQNQREDEEMQGEPSDTKK